MDFSVFMKDSMEAADVIMTLDDEEKVFMASGQSLTPFLSWGDDPSNQY